MRITEMNAKDGARKVRIFVSEMVRNNDCDDFKPHYGWWWCVVGGEVGYFTTKRPYSGVQLRGDIESHEHDIFNVNEKIESREQFAKLLSM